MKEKPAVHYGWKADASLHYNRLRNQKNKSVMQNSGDRQTDKTTPKAFSELEEKKKLKRSQ